MGDPFIVSEGWLIKHADGAQGKRDTNSNALDVWLALLSICAVVIGAPARCGQVHVRFASSWKHRDVVKQLLRRGKGKKRFHDQGVYTVDQHAILPHSALQKDLWVTLIC